MRKIELGIETANKVEVRSGLKEGDMVVIGGRATLQPGEEVRPKVIDHDRLETVGKGTANVWLRHPESLFHCRHLPVHRRGRA